MAKVSKKDERLARALVMMDCTANTALFEALGNSEINKRIETRWVTKLDEARELNLCLKIVSNNDLDGDTDDALTPEEYDSL